MASLKTGRIKNSVDVENQKAPHRGGLISRLGKSVTINAVEITHPDRHRSRAKFWWQNPAEKSIQTYTNTPKTGGFLLTFFSVRTKLLASKE
jgi:hypothetical protein